MWHSLSIKLVWKTVTGDLCVCCVLICLWVLSLNLTARATRPVLNVLHTHEVPTVSNVILLKVYFEFKLYFSFDLICIGKALWFSPECRFYIDISRIFLYLETVVSHFGCPVAPDYQLFRSCKLIFMILIIMTLYLNDVKINTFVWIKVSYCMRIVLICLWTCHLYWLKYGILSSVWDFDRKGWLPQTSPDVLPKGV